MSGVLNLVKIDTILFLISAGFLPLNIISNKHLAIISFFCIITSLLLSLKYITSFNAFSIIGICFFILRCFS